ncbi:MAG TPA: 5-amino-6-(D-ribitylamino)uracil--L-tyrosine 4-hydroxyphenyl transferase CofH [Methanocella sp.]|nr:5-amino-6-(D-ribitylamino)uracil--L-tyrosine 4-hydroxyphenyl transferase CofH [Methanocella sp.]
METDIVFKEIYRRSLDGKITKKDAAELLMKNPFELFETADAVRRELVGDTVSYVVNRNINFTDKCIGTCRFCAFRNSAGFHLSTEEILKNVGEARRYGATEVCIQGGLLRDMYLDDYVAMLEAIKGKYEIDVHAFSPMEVFHMSRLSGVSVAHSLKALKAAGLGSMPGTAAEILDDGIRRRICPHKLSTRQWVDVVTRAHKAGIPTTATMMYGHIETWKHRIDHLFIIREIQRKTHGFTEYVPLTFMSKNNPLGATIMKERGSLGASGLDDLRMYALSRLIFGPDLVNVQASWVKLSPKLAQVALYCGANDVGGTLMVERISRSAGATSGECMSPAELRALILDAGRIPRQRTTLYQDARPAIKVKARRA